MQESILHDGTTTTKDYIYDYENLLTSVIASGVVAISCVYDGAGKRSQTVENGVTTNYLYDGLSSIIERNPSGVTTKLFTRIPGNAGGISGLISMDTPLDTSADKFNGKTMFYHYDAIGNVVSMSGANGAQHAKYVNEAFGNQLQSTGTWTTANQYEFSTKQKDTTGLVFYGARYYNPQIGRWITKDPMKTIDGPNMYAFVGNNSVNYVDEWGEFAVPGAIIGAVSGVLIDVALQGGQNLLEGQSFYHNIDWGSAIVSGSFGAVAGGTGLGVGAQLKKASKSYKLFKVASKNIKFRKVAMALGKYRNAKATAIQVLKRNKAVKQMMTAVCKGAVVPSVKHILRQIQKKVEQNRNESKCKK